MSPTTDWEALAQESKEANKGFQPAPDGTYNLTITDVKIGLAKDSGNTKFDAEMVIDEGPFKNKKVWHTFTVARDNKKALGIFFQNMNVFGMPIDFFNKDTKDEAIRDNLVGKRLSADLVVDTYNPDKPKNKINPGWSIKTPTRPAEVDPMMANNGGNSGVPSSSMSPDINQSGPPPAYANQNYQHPPATEDPWQTPPQQTQQYAPPPQQYAQAPAQQQAAPPQVQQYSQEAPPPPPPGATWGAPPPPPPGLSN